MMNLIKFPQEIKDIILSHIKCHRCNKNINLFIDGWCFYKNNKYCNNNCTEYYHF